MPSILNNFVRAAAVASGGLRLPNSTPGEVSLNMTTSFSSGLSGHALAPPTTATYAISEAPPGLFLPLPSPMASVADVSFPLGGGSSMIAPTTILEKGRVPADKAKTPLVAEPCCNDCGKCRIPASTAFLAPTRTTGAEHLLMQNLLEGVEQEDVDGAAAPNFNRVLEAKRAATGILNMSTQANSSNKSKYYSIDHIFNMCGETCLYDWQYPLYKLFEPGLTKADEAGEAICAKKKYGVYKKTVTHGFGPVKDTLDLYGPDETDEKPVVV